MQVTFSFMGASDQGQGAHILNRAGQLVPPVPEGANAAVLVACERDEQITPLQFITMARLADACREHTFAGELCAYSTAVSAIRQIQRAV